MSLMISGRASLAKNPHYTQNPFLGGLFRGIPAAAPGIVPSRAKGLHVRPVARSARRALAPLRLPPLGPASLSVLNECGPPIPFCFAQWDDE